MDSHLQATPAPERPTLVRDNSLSSLVGIPYHHNLDLQQLFDTSRTSLIEIEHFFQLNAGRPILARRLILADQSLERLTNRFCHTSSAVPDEISYLLVLFLQQLYELTSDYVSLECPPSDSPFSLPPDVLAGLTAIPQGQVSLSFEKQVQGLRRLSENLLDRIEEFVHGLHRQITRATRNTSPKERMVEMVEFWVAQLVALSLYAFPKLMDDVSDSVDHALKGIREVLDMRELRYATLIIVCLTG